jgi:hypothetical protein
MEIQCPSCQKKLSIGDQFAGQLVKCPACTSVFMAPSLAMPVAPLATPVAPDKAVPAVAPTLALPMPTPAAADVIAFSGEPPPRPAAPFTPPPLPAPPIVEEAPPGPPGEFQQARTIRLLPDVLRWVAPAALSVLFVLSFFPWLVSVTSLTPTTVVRLNLWESGFSDLGSVVWIFYLLLTLFLALPLAWVKLLMEMNILPTLDFLKPVWFWRAILVGGILAVALSFATLAWLRQNAVDATSLGMSLGLRAHFIALVAYGLEFWLVYRKKTRLPLPELTVRW